MKWIAIVAALALTLVSGAVFARAGGQETPPAKAHAKASLEDLTWLAGSWTGEMFEQPVEETWSQAAAGSMMGMFRLPGEKTIFEFLLLEEESGGITMRFHHYSPGLKVWEKDGPLEFTLIEAEPRLFTFESPDPAQSPTRILYGWSDQDQLIVTVETVRDGKVKESFDVVYSRIE